MNLNSSSIQGFDKLIKKLESLGVDAENTLYESTKKNTKMVKNEAITLCSVDTEDLRKSIVDEVKRTEEGISGIISTNSDHGPYVEFGTGKVGEDTPASDKYPGPISYKQDKWLGVIPDVGPRYIEGQPAKPFLYPALKNNEDKVIAGIKKDLEETIRKVVK
ncbi:HK97-gp10 family putative phage morphogenesis protein [Clostridium sp. HBUAS56017]|uniref:HK97-gp10 family putative phage morphogenesis protein n=1 Tax=Clostridium sp. HBUAS56017 TaxID=2571128 RepID=UPI0011784E21|nr:HK97-gp10 family putative phage morphogenesis protein [Clostridium sp. HBUAS56017]